jgi:hypothetical protein
VVRENAGRNQFGSLTCAADRVQLYSKHAQSQNIGEKMIKAHSRASRRHGELQVQHTFIHVLSQARHLLPDLEEIDLDTCPPSSQLELHVHRVQSSTLFEANTF